MGRTTIGPTRIALAVGLKVLETAAARLGNRNMTKEHHTDVCVDDLGGFEIHRTAFLGVSFTGSRRVRFQTFRIIMVRMLGRCRERRDV